MTTRIKRPRDPIQLAKLVGDIATGQTVEPKESARSKGSRQGGLVGGKARAEKLTQARRKEIAIRGAQARWKGDRSEATPESEILESDQSESHS